MLRCQALAGAHYIFGSRRALRFSTIGIVELELGSASGLVLLLFVIPLAFTLNATRTELRVRKQRNKSSMLEKLNYVLVFSVVVTLIFVVSSFSSSGRLAGAPRQFAGPSLLGLVLYDRVSLENFRKQQKISRRFFRGSDVDIHLSIGLSTLVLPDELLRDEADAKDYDLENMADHTGGRSRDDSEAALVGGQREPSANDGNVVFEIGDDDDDDRTPGSGYRRAGRPSGEDGRVGKMNAKGTSVTEIGLEGRMLVNLVFVGSANGDTLGSIYQKCSGVDTSLAQSVPHPWDE
ncbi:hypothetical protein PQX77_019825 [Marasmius sp. AFHP31]|nr:hypothetical protein PQX77_019825 [Marasmius sp. AFHP31]